MKKILLYLFVFAFTNALSAQVVFEEDFEGGIGSWTTIDRDGDGNGWTVTDYSNQAITPPSGTMAATSASWIQAGALRPDNALISPPIDLSAVSGTILLDWRANGEDQTWAQEHYKVVVTTEATSDAIDAGTIVYEGKVGTSLDGVSYNALTRSMTDFAGMTVHVAFVHYNVTDQFRLSIDDVKVYTSNNKDIAVTALKSPDNSNGCGLTSEENISVTLTNLGGQVAQDFEVSYSINGGATVTEMVTEAISPAAEYNFTFAAVEDLSTLGSYEIEITSNLDGDGDKSNDTGVYDFVNSDAVFTVHMMTDQSSAQQWELEDNATGEIVASDYDGYQWNIEVTEDFCIFADKCYTFRYVGEMAAGTYLELLIDGVRVFGDADGNGVPARIDIPAFGNNCPKNDAGMGRISTNQYEPVNADAPISFTARNRGSNAINSFTATYSVGGSTPVEETFTQLIDLGGEADFTFATPHNVAALTAETLEINITKVNGTDDPVMTNNMASQPLVALNSVPVKSVLVEEGTGTWCPWCPRGDVGVKSITAAHPDDVIAIAVHNGPAAAPDPMDFGDYDSDLIALVDGGGYPFAGIDRSMETDPSAADLEVAYQQMIEVNAPVSLSLDAVLDDVGTLKVDVSAEVHAAALNGDYRFAVVLTEDGLSGTTSDWDQANNYAGGGFGPMGGYENLPNPVPASQMVYDHVARELLGGFSGAAGSVPAASVAGDVHTYTFETVLSPLFDHAQMHAVVLFLDGATGAVLNSESVAVRSASGTNDVFNHDIARVFPNPFSTRTNIELSLEGSQNVEMVVLNALGQKVAQRDYGMLSGKTILPFNSGNLQNGFYYFHIQVDDVLITKKVMLNK